MREFLKGLELDKETIDTIMAEYGKNLQGLKEQVDDYKTKISDYEKQLKDMTEKSNDSQKLQDELKKLKDDIATRETEEKAKKAEETLNNNILAVFGDKKFSSEYAKNGLLSDIKAAMKKEENQGKGIKDLFDELTKDKTGIFENPNQIKDMTPMGDIDNTISKETFDKMSYKERIELKQENPALFEKYNSN